MAVSVSAMTDTLSVTLGSSSLELPVTDGTIRANDLKKVATDAGPLATYDPGLMNTATCRSAITFIDGDAGVLEYRGFPIEQLAESASFLEVAWLLIKGEPATASELACLLAGMLVYDPPEQRSR